MIDRQRALLIPFILLFWWLAFDSLTDDSPVMDEQNHLARGVAFLQTADPRLSVEHPTLVNSLAALPVLTLPQIDLPTDQPSWQDREPIMTFWYDFADQFLWRVNQDVVRMIFLGRFSIVCLTLGLGLLMYRFAGRLWGRTAATFALLFTLFDPNILAHGRYITTDLGGTFFMLLATMLIWHMWRKGDRISVFWATLGIAGAFAAKLSAVLFIPIWLILTLFPLPNDQTKRFGPRLGRLATAGIGSLFFVWMLFAFEWGDFLFIDERLLWLNHYSGPMPTFWSGIERISLLSSGGRTAFLLQQFSTEGFFLYFPIAFLVKTPLITLGLLAPALFFMVRQAKTRPQTIWLLVPTLSYFAITLLSGLNLGYRHLMPILPFVYLIISGWLSQLSLASRPAVKSIPNLAGWVSILLLIATTLSIHPHHLSYFNLIAGGPSNGHNILIDSNIDWGQDLYRLKEWMRQNDVPEVNLAWFGTADPAYFAVPHQQLPGLPYGFPLWWDVPFDTSKPPPGVYAISVTNYWETPLSPEEKTRYAWFRERNPDARIGYSILIYRVE